MTMPGFTAAAASGEPVGRYITLTSFGVSAPGVRPQLDEKDYAADDPTDPSLVPLGDVGTGSLLGGARGVWGSSKGGVRGRVPRPMARQSEGLRVERRLRQMYQAQRPRQGNLYEWVP